MRRSIQDIYATLIGLPPNHRFWRNRWLFTQPVVTNMRSPQMFEQWLGSTDRELKKYIREETPYGTH